MGNRRWGDGGEWCNRCAIQKAVSVGLCETCKRTPYADASEEVVALRKKLAVAERRVDEYRRFCETIIGCDETDLTFWKRRAQFSLDAMHGGTEKLDPLDDGNTWGPSLNQEGADDKVSEYCNKHNIQYKVGSGCSQCAVRR